MRQYENFGNNTDYLYAMYKKSKNDNSALPIRQSQPSQGLSPSGGLIGFAKNIYDKAMARRHDGMYQGKPVIGSEGTDKENAMMGQSLIQGNSVNGVTPTPSTWDAALGLGTSAPLANVYFSEGGFDNKGNFKPYDFSDPRMQKLKAEYDSKFGNNNFNPNNYIGGNNLLNTSGLDILNGNASLSSVGNMGFGGSNNIIGGL